jgi:hypothetical protein
MARERTLTKLELIPAVVSGRNGWVQARWERSDGSKGRATAAFRRESADRWYISELLVTLPTSELLRDVPLERIKAAANADPEVREWVEKSAPPLDIDAQGRPIWRRYRLKRPAGRRLDDAFYARVATAYLGAVAHGLPPAKTLAADSDTPPGTVNRWIAVARERGMLGKTTAGKASMVPGEVSGSDA